MNNLDTAIGITERINSLLAVRVQLKAAIATSELGPANIDAVVAEHPLATQINNEITRLRADLVILI